MKKNTTYRLAESTVSIVKDLADKEGCSQSNVIDKAILMYCSIYYGIVDMRDNSKGSLNDTCNTMVKQEDIPECSPDDDVCMVNDPPVGRHADVVITDDTGDFSEEFQGKQPTDYGEFIEGVWTPYVKVDPASDPQPELKKISPLLAYARKDNQLDKVRREIK